MAITVKWDDGATQTWEEGCCFEPSDLPRGPFMIKTDDGTLLALVPDFGVRYVELEP